MKLRYHISRNIARLLPDKLYLSIKFWTRKGYWMDWKHPKTFCEKLQWLKVYDKHPEYTMMVDKLAAKDYVANIIGREYIIPTLAIFDSADDVDFDALPNQFVLKCTHDSGGLVVCRDKSKLNYNEVRKKLRKGLKRTYIIQNREYPYKNVARRIIAEQYLENSASPTSPLVDYKFFCFNGEPRYCQVIQDRNTKETIDFFDMEWNHQEFIGLNPRAVHAIVCPRKPQSFETMKQIAKALSQGIPFSRIDLYDINGKPYFGEITFFPASGMGMFTPNKYDEILGEMIQL